MATFNLNLLPIHRYNGQDSAEMPGLLAVTPPRKTARGRERDQFVVYLTLTGTASLSNNILTKLTNDATSSFYQSHGPLTSAMRKAVDRLTEYALGKK